MTTPGKRFRSGHNNVGQKRSKATRQKLRAQKLGSRNPAYGKKPGNWNGGRSVTKHGYVLLHSPGHPHGIGSRRSYVMEHRVVMEQHLREVEPTSEWLVDLDGELYLRRDAEVHHRDGDKANNVVSNLAVMSKADHARLHMNLSA